jgi:hypothetical protein
MSTDLLSRIPEWERQADIFEQKAHALRQMAEAVRVLNGDAARLFAVEAAGGIQAEGTLDEKHGGRLGINQYSTAHGPRGREAVRQIVADRPGLWLVKDIKRINRERGWPSDDAGIETAVIRMAKKGDAVKVRGRKGVYTFGMPEELEASALSRVTLPRDGL